MDSTIEEGFYIDPDTHKLFFVKQSANKKMTLIPHWVKSKPSDWKKVVNTQSQTK